MTRWMIPAALCMLVGSSTHAKRPPVVAPAEPAERKMLYTTYFYTAGEAIVQGYEPNSKVRIISLDKGGTIWEGKVNAGQSVLVPTGAGVFGFVSDHKAAILVGTPSTCTVLGYFVKDKDGHFRSDHFFAQMPSTAGKGSKLIIWAWDDVSVTVSDDHQKAVWSGKIKAGNFHELAPMPAQNLQFQANKSAMGVQVYQDEGFVVPSKDGRATGTEFYTYVGDVTEGVNDLQIISFNGAKQVTVTDLKTGENLWSGEVPKAGVKAITMAGKFVKVVSDQEISVGVGAYEHYKGGYAEHHFAMGIEGTGIDRDFLVTTPGELWIFSYFTGNEITVTDVNTGKDVWSGKLNAGQVSGLQPGYGFFRVKATKGTSVMGGASACGGEYSPAAGLFAVDEALFKVIREVREQRIEKAKNEGRKASAAEINAPLSPAEMDRARKAVQASPNAGPVPKDEELKERLDTLQHQ